jgi:peptidoglycan/LPS O-acetylase OafA/YrhL
MLSKIDRKEAQRLDHLDILRGLAALIVFIGHERSLFFVDSIDLVNPNNWLIKFFYFLTGFGHQAVIVFFVLSGFFISSSIFKARDKNLWTWESYLIARLSRLLVVLIPSIFLCAFWDKLGIKLFGIDGIYSGNSLNGNLVNFPVVERLSIITAIGNTLFLQEILVPTFGSNTPLWSLSCEFWYYILFPLLLAVFYASTIKNKSIYAGILFLLIFFVGDKITRYFPIWLMGATLSILPTIKLLSKYIINLLFLVLTFILLAIALLITRTHNFSHDLVSDYLLAICFCFYIYARFTFKNIFLNVNIIFLKLFKYAKIIAEFSYTLYLLHLPLLVFLKSWLSPNHRWQPNFSTFILAIIILLTILAYAFFISLITEAKTTGLRNYLKNILISNKINKS